MTRPGDETAAAAGGRDRLRASHADREQVIDALKAAFVQGRLDKGELDARVGQAFASRTCAELAALTGDIPAGPAASPPPREPDRAQARATGACEHQDRRGRDHCGSHAGGTRTWGDVAPNRPCDIGRFDFRDHRRRYRGLAHSRGSKLESRHRNRSGGQLPPRSTPGTGGQASRHPASAASAEQFPQVDHGQQHTAEAARRDLADPQSPGLTVTASMVPSRAQQRDSATSSCPSGRQGGCSYVEALLLDGVELLLGTVGELTEIELRRGGCHRTDYVLPDLPARALADRYLRR